jgi:hypothetical protein
MGYTHYWKITERLDKDWDKWTSFLPDAMKIMSYAEAKLDIPLADAFGETKGDEQISLSGVSMNGYAENSHDSFVLSPEVTEFDFCKTAQKPYDTVVTAILVLAKETFGEAIEVSTDGELEDWNDGLYLYEKSLNRFTYLRVINSKLANSHKTYEVYVKRTEYGLIEVAANTPEEAKARAGEYVIEGMTKWGACFETYWTENEDEPQLTEIGNEK